MAQFSINTQRVRPLAGDEAAMARRLSGYADEIRQIADGLGMSSRTASGIQSSLRSAAGKTDRHSGSMSGMNSALSSIADKYDSAERAIRNSSRFKAIASGGAADALKASSAADIQNWLVRMSGIFSPVVTILQEQIGNITEIIRSAGKTDTTDRRPTAGWAAGVTAGAAGVMAGATELVASPGAVIGTAPGGAPRYKLPDYVTKDIDPYANGFYGPYLYRRNGTQGHVCEWNTSGVQLSCTYYTLRKLNERGLSYPCVAGPGNGGQWYGNFDHESGLPNAAGDNALYELAGSLTLPQENIVVSFDGTSSKNIEWGHVLLIDEMYRDANGTVRVKYSDMWNPDIRSLNGSNPPIDQTLDEFISYNKEHVGIVNGAAVIGAGNR